jgi:RHS repeat-associated protein
LTVTLPDGRVIEYVYDPLSRRIAKKIDGVIVEKYLWQGLTQLLAVYDGSDTLLMRFEYADGRMPIAMVSGGSAYYLAYDQVGLLRVVADASGNVVKRIDYDSFGNVIEDTDPSFMVPFGFAGGLHDRDTGLVRFGYRDYDPDTGRWTAKDPILFAGGDTDLYGYCLADPINMIDPSGLLNWGKLAAGVGVFTGGAGIAVGGVALTATLLSGEHALAVPTAGASMLLTGHSVSLGGTIVATGGTLMKLGFDMIKEALSEEDLSTETTSKPCK